jgi:hypothetical protein
LTRASLISRKSAKRREIAPALTTPKPCAGINKRKDAFYTFSIGRQSPREEYRKKRSFEGFGSCREGIKEMRVPSHMLVGLQLSSFASDWPEEFMQFAASGMLTWSM